MTGFSAKTLGDTPGQVGKPAADAVGVTTTLNVTWTALAEGATGGSAVMGYDIQIWDSDNQQWVDEGSVGTVLAYADEGLAGGDTHYYRVRARNSEGSGPWSANSVMAVVPNQSPDAPMLSATPTSTNEVRLTWTIPNNNGTVINGYTLQRWGTDDDAPAWSADLLEDAADFVDTTLFIDRRPRWR